MFTTTTFRLLLSVLVSVILLAAWPSYGQDNKAAQELDDLIAKVKRDEKIQQDKIDEAVDILTRAGEVLPAAELLDKLYQLQQYRQDKIIPTARKRLSKDMQPDYAILSLQVRKMRQVSAEQVKAHPAAEAFPGPVPEDAKQVRRKIEINTSVAGWHLGSTRSRYWHSTGLYAKPPGHGHRRYAGVLKSRRPKPRPLTHSAGWSILRRRLI
jgi:hypothetical protein